MKSVNIFDLICEDKAASTILNIKSKLAMNIISKIRDNQELNSKIKESFKLSGIKIEDLKQGKLNDFTIEQLIEMSVLLGDGVAVEYHPLHSRNEHVVGVFIYSNSGVR